MNPFHDDYYRKAVYNRNKEQPPKINRPHINKGPSKEKNRVLVITQEDEGFNWNKYIPNEGVALVAELRWNREEEIARKKLGNIATDPKTIDFDALVKTIPTVEEEYKDVIEAMMREEEAKNKYVEDIIDVKQEMTAENLKKMADRAMMAKQNEVETPTKSTESLNQVRSMNKIVENGKETENEEQWRNCMEPCKACTEKDKALKSRNAEFTKINDLLKETNKKIDLLKDDLILKDELIKSSKDKIDLLEDNLKKGESEKNEEAYDELKRVFTKAEERDYQRRDLNNKLQSTLEEKQKKTFNTLLDDIAKLKLQLEEVKIENEIIGLKPKSYYSASFVVDYIIPKPIGKNKDGEDVYSNGGGVGYNRVPPPMNGDFSKKT
ncbi:hypothetical protein Hanom_Chr09g00787411 [Helianthus anomalus]